jgi:RNA-binding protein
MLTGKQRSYLKGLAHNEKALMQLGKEGLSEGFISQLDALLESHELIKVSVLDNSLEDPKAAAIEVCEALKAEYVQSIGNKFTIYRQSKTDPMIEIPGADNSRVRANKSRKASQVPKQEKLSKRGGKISKPNQNKNKKKTPRP